VHRGVFILTGLLTIAAWLGGCSAMRPVARTGPIEPFATVESLDGGSVYLEVDPVAHHTDGAVMRVNDLPWATEAVVRRGDWIEIGYLVSPHAGRLAYRTIGASPAGRIHFEASRWFDDGFPAQTRRVAVWPYRDGTRTSRVR